MASIEDSVLVQYVNKLCSETQYLNTPMEVGDLIRLEIKSQS